jgi:hypothetical protein
MLLIVRQVMPLAPLGPMMTLRSEILIAALLAISLAAELVDPIAVQLVFAALFVPLGIAVAVARRSVPSERRIPAPSPFLPSFASRAPPVS